MTHSWGGAPGYGGRGPSAKDGLTRNATASQGVSEDEVNPNQYQRDQPCHLADTTSSRPVEQVDWPNAVEFCRKLSELPPEKAAGAVYRLPTEAEWEYACRAGTTTRYSFGDNTEALNMHVWWERTSQGQTQTVGRLRPNAWGLFDMYGNVWEWCSDWHDSGYYATSPVDDPTGAAIGSDRAFRGGGWVSVANYYRSSHRGRHVPAWRYNDLGFRVASVPADASRK